jgi:hypothetical protein
VAAITDISDLINLLTNGSAQHYNVFIDSRSGASPVTATIAGQLSSLWKYNKSTGANGQNPPSGVGEAPNRLTQGALRHTNAASGKELWLLGVEAVATSGGSFVMYDRLVHTRGLSGLSTAAQAVNTAPLTRNVSGVGNQIWIEIYTQIGTAATTITANYTNQVGVAGKITLPVVFGGTNAREEARLIRLPLADGDTGVQSVQTTTSPLSTNIQGDYGITIARPLVRGFVEGAATACFRDLLTGVPSMVTIPDDACLALGWVAASAVPPRLDFSYHVVEK